MRGAPATPKAASFAVMGGRNKLSTVRCGYPSWIDADPLAVASACRFDRAKLHCKAHGEDDGKDDFKQ